MFNRQDMYNDYSDESLVYKYDSIFNGDISTAFAWYYGDDVTLDFHFAFEDDSDERWENTVVEFEFYNFRHEKIYSIVTAGAGDIDLFINNEVSASTFPRGVYFCSAKIRNLVTNEVQTALGASDCLMYVK